MIYKIRYSLVYIASLKVCNVCYIFPYKQQNANLHQKQMGAQWLSGRVLDSRPKGHGFEPHRRHCVVVLEQDTFILA